MSAKARLNTDSSSELSGSLPPLAVLLTAAAPALNINQESFSPRLGEFRPHPTHDLAGAAREAAASAARFGEQAVEIAKKPEVQEAAKSLAKSMLGSVKDWAVDIAHHPQKLVPIVWGFAKSLSDGLGISDICAGTFSLGKAAVHLATFDFDRAGQDLRDAGRAVKGAATLVAEFTGLADCGRAIKCAMEGNYAGALFYGALGVGQAAALFVTFGGMNLLTNGTKMAAREGFETMAKEAGESVVKELGERITSTELKAVGAEIAEHGGRKLAEIAEEKGAAAVTENLTREVLKDVAEGQTIKLLEKHSGKEVVERFTLEALEQISKSSRRDLAEHLMARGMEEAAALKAAGAMKTLLGKAGGRAMFDTAIKDIFVNEITGQVKEDLLKRGMAEGFKEAWEKQTAMLAEKGIEKEMLIRAGTEGFEAGVESGVRKVVRAGVESAFRRFRGKLKLGQRAEDDGVEGSEASPINGGKPVEYGHIEQRYKGETFEKRRFAWKKDVYESKRLLTTDFSNEKILREEKGVD